MAEQTYIAAGEATEAEQEQSSFWRHVEAFRVKAAEFVALYNQLATRADIAATDPALQRDYAALMAAGESLRGKVQSVTEAIDWGKAQIDRFGDLFSLSGARVSELGIAPLVLIGVVATIAGGLTLLGNWVADAYTLNKRLEVARFRSAERERLLTAGYSLEDAERIARESFPEEKPGWIEQLTTLVIWTAVGFGVFWIVKQASQ